MRNCVCGSAIHDGGALCGECSALNELGLAAGATLDEVKTAYRMLVKVWHPDRFQSDQKLAHEAETKLKALNRAFSYLTAEGYKGGGGSRGGAGHAPGSGEGPGTGAAETRTTAAGSTTRARPQRSTKVRASRVKQRSKPGFGKRLVLRLLVLVVLLGIWAFFMRIADAYVAADPTMGRYYVGFKTKLKSDFEDVWQRTWGDLEQRLHGILGGGPGTVPKAAPMGSEQAARAPEPGATAPASAGKHAAMNQPATPVRLLPYVTVGLTREEVVSVQGEPTASSDDKLMYNRSEVELKDGKVVGWKIDPRSPLRVKLWPEGTVDTGLRFFTVGSSKDEVLVVQGTPTAFSDDRFEYGGSAVYFRQNLVVGWKNEPGSVQLRTER
jgi:curved DNA-binding protein CbpA